MVAAVFAGSRAPWGPDGEGPVRGVGVAVVLPLPRVEKAGRAAGPRREAGHANGARRAADVPGSGRE